MKQYQNVPMKRKVQDILFSNTTVKGYDVKGLAGNNPVKYANILSKYFQPRNIYLYDINPEVRNTCNRHINIKPITETIPSNIMDCDFCSSIVSDGDKLQIIYNKMLQLSGQKMIAFTFSLRLKGGRERTLNYIKEVFNTQFNIVGIGKKEFKGSPLKGNPYYSELITDNPNIKLVSYRDTSCMLSGTFTF